MIEFRPINHCNVTYKIIFKLICKRLRRLSPRLILETQSAFVAKAQENFMPYEQTRDVGKILWPLKHIYEQSLRYSGMKFYSGFDVENGFWWETDWPYYVSCHERSYIKF